jgi:hypothetical protein
MTGYSSMAGAGRVISNTSAVLREQLEYLIAHTEGRVECDCPECQRYLRVCSILLEIFDSSWTVYFPRTASGSVQPA